jgi:hypothetical protein
VDEMGISTFLIADPKFIFAILFFSQPLNHKVFHAVIEVGD